MFDSESGAVDRDAVIKVLRFHRVEISPDSENEGSMLLVRSDIIKSVPIPPWCSRRFVHYLQRTFNIPIHHFYHPEMMGDASGHVN